MAIRDQWDELSPKTKRILILAIAAVVMVVAGAYLIYYWLLGPGNLLLS